MIRKTTPTHTFKLPVGSETLKNVQVVYAQFDDVVLRKYKEDVTLEQDKIIVNLTAEETLKFLPNVDVKAKVFIKTNDDKVIGSQTIILSCDDCLCEELL